MYITFVADNLMTEITSNKQLSVPRTNKFLLYIGIR